MARIGESADLLKCSFCGKSQKQVQQLIAGPGVYICDECVELCNEIIEERLAEAGETESGEFDLPKPKEIFSLPRGVRHRPGAREERALRRGLQPLQAGSRPHHPHVRPIARTTTSRSRSRTSCSSVRPAAARPTSRRPSRSSSTCPSRSPMPRRSPRPATSAKTSRTSCSSSSRPPTTTSSAPRPASSTSTRSTRSPARPRTRRSRGTSRARACSRRC